MPGWHLEVLGGTSLVPTDPVLCTSDFLSLSVQHYHDRPGSIELHLPRGSSLAEHFVEGRQVRLYRGTVLKSGGFITHRVYSGQSVRVLCEDEAGMLRRTHLPPDILPMSGESNQGAWYTGWYRTASSVLEWLLRPPKIVTYRKDRWTQCGFAGGTYLGDFSNLRTTDKTIEIVTPEIDLGEAMPLDQLILEYGTEGGIATREAFYSTSASPGGTVTPATTLLSVQEDTTQKTTDSRTLTGRARVYFSNPAVSMSRYVRFRVRVVTTTANSQIWFALIGVFQGTAVLAKGANWSGTADAVSRYEKQRSRAEGDIEQWWDKNLLSILEEQMRPLGYEWAVVLNGNTHELHLYDTASGGRGTDKTTSVNLIWGDNVGAGEWATTGIDRLLTLLYGRGRIVTDDFFTSGGEPYNHVIDAVENAAGILQHGRIHETRGVTVSPSMTATIADLTDELVSLADPETEFELPVVRPDDNIHALALGDFVTLLVPEHDAEMTVRVQGIGYALELGSPERVTLTVTTQKRTPYSATVADATQAQLRRQTMRGRGSYDAVRRFVRMQRRLPPPLTEPGD